VLRSLWKPRPGCGENRLGYVRGGFKTEGSSKGQQLCPHVAGHATNSVRCSPHLAPIALHVGELQAQPSASYYCHPSTSQKQLANCGRAGRMPLGTSNRNP